MKTQGNDNPSAKPEPGTTMLALVGPTGAGKTATALEISPRLDAEIVSIDSVKVYRGLDIGAAKPAPGRLTNVPYHLIDIADPNRDFSVAVFKENADTKVADIYERGKLPFLVGGSGLYYRAVVDDLDFAQALPVEVRVRESREATSLSTAELHALLEELDPAAASAIPPSNRRRVIRALEVANRGARLMSESQSSWKGYSSPYKLIAAGLEVDRPLLNRMIERRVDRMIAMGLEAEVRMLAARGLSRGSTAGEAIGYRQMLDHIDGGATLEQTIEEIKKRTRQFAKRQMTWFKKDPRIRWLRMDANASSTDEEIEEARQSSARIILEYMLDKLEN